NARELRDELVGQGSIFQSNSDTEVLLHLYARSKASSVDEAVIDSVSQVQGAFSLVILTRDRLIAVRDPHGFRPLALGRLGDAVVPVPDSGVCAAMGYAEESRVPLRMGLIRNHYVGRTFIQPQAAIRHFGVKVKLNPVKSILEGRRVVLVDDSIVRGTTSRKI